MPDIILTREEADQLWKIASRISEQGPKFTMDFGFGTVEFNNKCRQSEFDYGKEDAYTKKSD